MQQLYHDAMATVRKLGKPDLVITFTCNPTWIEIKEAILPNQSPSDRPDIISRVFRMKLNDIQKKQVFGKVIGLIHVIEFQKRGLPHAHILLLFLDGGTSSEIEAAIGLRHCRNKMILKYLF